MKRCVLCQAIAVRDTRRKAPDEPQQPAVDGYSWYGELPGLKLGRDADAQ